MPIRNAAICDFVPLIAMASNLLITGPALLPGNTKASIKYSLLLLFKVSRILAIIPLRAITAFL